MSQLKLVKNHPKNKNLLKNMNLQSIFQQTLNMEAQNAMSRNHEMKPPNILLTQDQNNLNLDL